MQIIEIKNKKPRELFCPMCGAGILTQKPDFCEHLVFYYDTLTKEFGHVGHNIALPVADEFSDPVPEDIYNQLNEDAVCFKILTQDSSNAPCAMGLENTSYVCFEMGDHVRLCPAELTTAELAALTGLSRERIIQMGNELIKNGVARKVGKVLVCSKHAINYVQNRPEKRGAHNKKK
ncbi:MAG: hypothetical protein GY874_05665 [Desulfobacteraceae bacterium]|nr:hypothetical protein [Desulfobacteraceae bacterium]